jgi:hypothetical protein
LTVRPFFSSFFAELCTLSIALCHCRCVHRADVLLSLTVPPWMYYQTNDVIGSFVDSGFPIILMSPLAFGQLQSIFQV